jgi:N-succinyldiaminopimelate aminotransferase
VTRALTKWQGFQTSIFTQMTQKAIKAGAVNLAQGFPDFDGPDEIKDAAIAAIKNGLNQYAPATGLPELRQLLARRQSARMDMAIDADTETTVFSGATEALYCATQALLEPGDELIAFEPFYDSYPAGAHAAGAKLVGVPLNPPEFAFDPKALANAITPRTKAIIVNTPHNPTGRVFGQAELEVIRELALKHDLWVITDEVYEELVYAPHRHIHLATMPGMAERTVTISSTSKTFSMTGWKVGYAFAKPALTGALRAVHQFTVFCSATPLQAGMIAALKLAPSYFSELNQDYKTKRDDLLKVLRDAGFKVRTPEGTYFALADYSPVFKGKDTDFADKLTSDVKVACIPISGFYTDPRAAAAKLSYVRFAFCKGKDTVNAAAKNLAALKSWR